LGVVITVGIFPVLGSIWLKHKQYLALNYKEAAAIEENIITNPKEIRDEGQENLFIAENEKESLSIVSSGLLYIESMDNYCQFVFMKDGQVKKQILRGPLKRFESQISLVHLRKCHRSFIVNLENVIHIDGNAQGYTLYLNQNNVAVPVSRNFGPEIKKFFSKGA
jgi:DNA-binding LytR/AlgR family response regulator